LKLNCDQPLSSSDFNFGLRHCIVDTLIMNPAIRLEDIADTSVDQVIAAVGPGGYRSPHQQYEPSFHDFNGTV
jgi:hypothetical protein